MVRESCIFGPSGSQRRRTWTQALAWPVPPVFGPARFQCWCDCRLPGSRPGPGVMFVAANQQRHCVWLALPHAAGWNLNSAGQAQGLTNITRAKPIIQHINPSLADGRIAKFADLNHIRAATGKHTVVSPDALGAEECSTAPSRDSPRRKPYCA